MTGSGLTYSGPTQNLYGQQQWAQEERSRIFSDAYRFALTRGGTRSLSSITEEDMGFALEYASSFLPQGAGLVGGLTKTLPFSSGNNKLKLLRR
jgi:hypothetical protein